jgi:hypothetical protein
MCSLMAVFCCADCTHSGDVDAIEIWEQLGGVNALNKCTWGWGLPGATLEIPTQDCTSLAFGRDCTRITGQVNIRFAMAQSWIDVSSPSQMGAFLQTLGIGNVTEMTGDLIITNIGVFIDAPTTLDIFPNLRRVSSLEVLGQKAASATTRFFTGFPGFQGLEQVKYLNLERTSLLDLTSFSGLKCVGTIRLSNNTALSSLRGMENARIGIAELKVKPDWGDLTINGPTGLVGAESLVPLLNMAGCEGGTVPSGTLYIEAACPDPINSWTALCVVVQNLDCAVSQVAPPPALLSPPQPADLPLAIPYQ